MKHRRMIVNEYTKGLPLPRRYGFLIELDDQSINPIRYKMLIRMDDELFVAGLVDSICFKQNMILYKTSFIC
ncbi:hypothetical protein BH23THE1_BH23THE1_33430 [soil metagenome]